jgi:hypothetical protein
MIGDTISLSSATTGTWGELPGQTSDAVVVRKVNNDNFSSSYRFTDDSGRYTVNIRNTVESANLKRPAYDRHNVQIIYERFATADGTVSAATFDSYFILRTPQGVSPAEIKPFVFALAGILGYEPHVTKLLNGES